MSRCWGNWSVFATIIVIFCGCTDASIPYEYVSYRGWEQCIRLSNDSVEVVINPQYGGQILHYSHIGKDNVLWADSVINGWGLDDYIRTRRSPDAGRFDVGYERLTENTHDVVWAGEYHILAGSIDHLIIRSDICSAMGIVVEREFRLGAHDSSLTIEQRMRNISNSAVEYCFWTRTLLPSGGVYHATYVESQRYLRGFSEISLIDDSLLETPPSESRIMACEGIFTAYPYGEQRRYGIDTRDGISSYQRAGVLYRKECDYVEGGRYENNRGERFANMIYFNDDFIELEPHSTMEQIEPGGEFSYTEVWSLSTIE